MFFMWASFFICCTCTVFAHTSGIPNDKINDHEIIGEDKEQMLQLTSDVVSGTNNKISDDQLISYSDSEAQVEYMNHNLTSSVNDTIKSNSTNLSNSTVQVSCLQNKTAVGMPVEIVNSTRLAAILQVESNITSRQAPGKCIAVLFYSPTCPFSCLAAPHFNALSRYFPDIKMAAVDAMTHRNFNAQYGIFGVPTLILFHNGRPAARLNETTDYSLEMFAKFIRTCTNVEPTGKLVVTSGDFIGPIPSVPVNENDYYLLLSWTVIALQLLYYFYRSSWGRWLVDATLSAWREAEAQHHHID